MHSLELEIYRRYGDIAGYILLFVKSFCHLVVVLLIDLGKWPLSKDVTS